MNKRWYVLIMVLFMFLFGAIASGSQAKNFSAGDQNSSSSAANWYVSSTGDDENDCASPTTPCATINVAIGKAIEGDTIFVTMGTYPWISGDFAVSIDKSLTITGGWDEVFTIQNGRSTVDGLRLGQCIETIANLNITITKFVLQNCSRNSNYGSSSLSNSARLLIEDSIIQDSSHLSNWSDGQLTLVRSIVRNNYSDLGGGISSQGDLTLIRSAITDNTAGHSGGGINGNSSQMTIINSTISDNTARDWGGGIFMINSGVIKIYNSTIVQNAADNSGGGLYVPFIDNVSMQNSIIADNHTWFIPVTAPDCFGTITSAGYNLIGNTTGCIFIPSTGDLLNVSPQAGRVDTYYALHPSSPAIDAANPDGCLDDQGNPILEDQRGALRPIDGNQDGNSVCDMGAYEYDPDHPTLFNFLPFAKQPCPIIYFDSFRDPASGWPVMDNGNSLLEYNNGEYRILARQPHWFIAARPGIQSTLYKVSVDLRNVSGVEGSYGIIFYVHGDWSQWFSLEIYPDGWFGVYRYDPYGGEILAEGYSPAINQGTVINHIQVEQLDAGGFRTYANGQLLTELHIIDPGLLYIGLINYSYSQPNVDVRYDNFKVSPLNCTEVKSLDEPAASLESSWIEQAQNFSQYPLGFIKHQP